jgi:hypothetical protein
MSNLELFFCWILGDEPPSRKMFSVWISHEATIGELKEAVKEKSRVAFDKIDMPTLSTTTTCPNPHISYLTPMSMHTPRLLRLMVTMRFWQQSLTFNGSSSKVSHGRKLVEVRLFLECGVVDLVLAGHHW